MGREERLAAVFEQFSEPLNEKTPAVRLQADLDLVDDDERRGLSKRASKQEAGQVLGALTRLAEGDRLAAVAEREAEETEQRLPRWGEQLERHWVGREPVSSQ